MKAFNQRVSTHLSKLSELFSCKSSCKVDIFSEDKENKNPCNSQKNYCQAHLKPISYYCTECQQFLCILCCQPHSQSLASQPHEFLELQSLETYKSKEIEKFLKEAREMLEKAQNDQKFLNLPDYQPEFQEIVDSLQQIKQDCLAIIENFFNTLTEDSLNLFKSLPCKFQKDSLELALSSFIQKLEETEALRENETKTNKSNKTATINKNLYEVIPEIKHFNEKNYRTELELLKKSFSVLQNFPLFSSKKPVLPKICQDSSQNLNDFLQNWVNLIGPTENPYDQLRKLRVSAENYYNPSYENYLARVDSANEQLFLYNLSTNTEEKVCLSCDFAIPKDNSLIITPDLQIILTGGVNSQQEVSDDVFFCAPNCENEEVDGVSCELALRKKQKMLEKRVYHCLCYAKGAVFCFGGRDFNGKTLSSCEKYCVETDQWSSISAMRAAKQQASACVFNNSWIYVFSAEDFVEKYEIEKNRWESIKPINFNHCLQAFSLATVQINPNQILVLGGEKHKEIEEKTAKVYSKNAFLFNIAENNLVSLGNLLPEPLVEPSQIVVCEKNVYFLGKREKNSEKKERGFNWKTEFEWVFRIKNGKEGEIIDFLSFHEK